MPKQNISITTDTVIFCKAEGEIKLLLVKRKQDPFKGQWALPGGFLEDEEPLEEGAKRELEEETGLKIKSLKQLKAFGTPGRDPRGRTISIVFYGETKVQEEVRGNDDAAEAKWFSVNALPQLAFDHSEIIKEANRTFQANK